jgi:hypothetical protein
VLGQRKKFVTVQSGNNIMDVLPRAEIFLYPEFRSGKVFLRNSAGTEARLNYSRLVDEMHFIDQTGDTVALDNENNVKYLAVGRDTFFYDNGYLRLISSGIFVKLAMKDVWVISQTRQRGAYNSTNNSVGMLSFKSVEEGGRLYDLVVDEDIILKKEEKYYFVDNFNRFVVANKTNLLLLFPKEQQRIGSYLKEHRINFKSRADLEKTVQFLEQTFQQ